MAKINDTTTYPSTTPAYGDLIPGTDISNTTNDANGETVNFSVQNVLNHLEITAKTASATSALADNAKLITMNNASVNVYTIAANADVAHAIGTCILVKQIGAGVTSITGATGVTLEGGGQSVSAGSCAISNRYDMATCIKVDTNIWSVQGAVGTIA